MEHSTSLDQLPDGLVFPDHLRERIAYDAPSKQLLFRGFMSKYTHDELIGLSKDPHYLAAAERLFVLSAREIAPPPARGSIPWVWAAVLAGSLAIAVVVVTSLMWSSHGSDPPPDLHSSAVMTGKK